MKFLFNNSFYALAFGSCKRWQGSLLRPSSAQVPAANWAAAQTRNLIVLVLLLLPAGLFADPRAVLSKDTIAKGEPLYIRIEADGDPQIEIPQNIISENGVTAEYVGVETNITAVNMKVTRKKIIKFRIVTSKHGKLKTPQVAVKIDDKKIQVQPFAFTVKQERYAPHPDPYDSVFDRIFSRNLPGRSQAYTPPAEDDLLVFFDTTKSKVYVGESVLGYFQLFYRNLDKPYLERNAGKALTFPFFSSEPVTDLNFPLVGSSTYNGKDYEYAVYSGEVFALTPLRKGTFWLGESTFTIEGGFMHGFSSFAPVTLESKKRKLEVLELPEPKPIGFSGEVGDYTIEVDMKEKEAYLNEPSTFTVRITGNGTGAFFKDPLVEHCRIAQCDYKFNLIRDFRTKKAVQLKDGSAGIASELNFQYSLFPEKKGKFQQEPIQIVFFHPGEGTYVTRAARFPELEVKERFLPDIKRPELARDYSGIFWGFAYLFLLSGLSYMLYGAYKSFGEQKLKNFFKLRTSAPEELVYMDRIIGQKKGALLKNFLLQKGWSKQKADELVKLKSASGNRQLAEIYQNAPIKERERILALLQKIGL